MFLLVIFCDIAKIKSAYSLKVFIEKKRMCHQQIKLPIYSSGILGIDRGNIFFIFCFRNIIYKSLLYNYHKYKFTFLFIHPNICIILS